MARRNLFATLMTLCLLVLAACGTPAAPTADAPSAAPAASQAVEAKASQAAEQTGTATTLRIALVDYTDEHKTWLEQEVIPAFQKDHANVTVEPIYLNWGTLNETYAGYFAAGEGPDILNLGSEFGPEYGDRLLPLNSYLSDWPELEQYLPATLETVTWNNELRGLPWLVMPRVYMCRSDLLEESGLQAMPKTFDEAISAAKAGTIVKDNKLERAGFWTNGAATQELQDWQEFVQLIYAAGGTLYNADGTPSFDSPQSKQALQFMYDRRRAVLPDENVAALGETQGARLALGEVTCMWTNVWAAPAADDPAWDNIVIGPSPAPDGGKQTVLVFTDWLGIPSYTKNPELAVEFLKFLGNQENQQAYNELFGSFSPRKDAKVESKAMQQQVELMDKYGKAFSDVRLSPKLTEILQAELPQFVSDSQDLETTVANIQQQYTEALREAGRIE